MKTKYFFALFLLPSFLLGQTESAILNIDATIPYQGVGEASPLLGSAEYKIFYSGNDTVIDKPIIFIDGFDPNDSRDIPSMYSLLDYGTPTENLGDVVRSEGFDLIVLNFPEEYFSPTDGTSVIRGGADFIQRNAYVLVELMNVINGLKVGDEENVIIGPSMGGLISRYALRYMEQNDIPHEARLFISFDSPHLGANVPIGLQYLFNYMVNGDPALTDAEQLVSGLLGSAAAKQMLIDHYLGHVDGGGVQQDGSTHTPKGAPGYRDAFQSELDAMGLPSGYVIGGFPENTIRNISITNGSGTGQTTGTPGMELINHTFDTGQVDTGVPFGVVDSRAVISMNFTPLSGQSINVTSFDGQANIFGTTWVSVFTYGATAESTASSDGLDSAPGGQFDLYSFDDGTNALITEFVANLNSQYFNFIPTLSGLAIDSEPNWYATPDENDSPFDDVFIPTNNEPHVLLTEDNVNFALNEIRSGTLSTAEVLKLEIKLAQNPIENELKILNNSEVNEAELTLVDITGKVVYKADKELNNETIIPLNLNSGLYLLNIKTDSGQLTLKVAVN